MSARTSLILLALTAPLAVAVVGCGGGSDSSPASSDTGVDSAISDTAIGDVGSDATHDAASDVSDATDAVADGTDASDALAPVSRTLTSNALFGDTAAQNLLIDPLFEFGGEFGIGRWMAETADFSSTVQGAATASNKMMSDAPVGLAFPVGLLSDATASTTSFELVSIAQTPGGPGPFHVHVWISTLDATASATLTGVTVALISAPDETKTISGIPSTAVDITEDTTSMKVIAGRTWHLFDGVSSGRIDLAGFLTLDFAASKNTWLLQAPEVVPTALETTPTSALRIPSLRTVGHARPTTPFERKAIDVYHHQRTRSVPASHPTRLHRPR